jgi:hypothetical protein
VHSLACGTTVKPMNMQISYNPHIFQPIIILFKALISFTLSEKIASFAYVFEAYSKQPLNFGVCVQLIGLKKFATLGRNLKS